LLPEEGRYLWNWFISLNSLVSRISDGVCKRIPPTEYVAWSSITGNLVYSEEYDILMSMDQAYCEETNKELASIRSKQEEEQRKQVEKAKSRRR